MFKRLTGVFRNAYTRASEAYDQQHSQQYIEDTNPRKRRRVDDGDLPEEKDDEDRQVEEAAEIRVVHSSLNEKLEETLGEASDKIAELQARIEELEYELVQKEKTIRELKERLGDDVEVVDEEADENVEVLEEEVVESGEEEDVEENVEENEVIADEESIDVDEPISPQDTVLSKEGNKLKQLEVLSPIKPCY